MVGGILFNEVGNVNSLRAPKDGTFMVRALLKQKGHTGQKREHNWELEDQSLTMCELNN